MVETWMTSIQPGSTVDLGPLVNLYNYVIIYIYVCMYVCMYVYIYIYIYIYMYSETPSLEFWQAEYFQHAWEAVARLHTVLCFVDRSYVISSHIQNCRRRTRLSLRP